MARDQWQVWLDGGDGDPFGVGDRLEPEHDPSDDGDRDREPMQPVQQYDEDFATLVCTASKKLPVELNPVNARIIGLLPSTPM